MQKKHVVGFLIATSMVLHELHAGASSKPVVCGDTPHPMRMTVRHIEGKGVGYNQGYTTLEGFFTPSEPWKNSWMPFLDLRGHVFNSGQAAANAGVGVRYLASRVWGVNTYYDYRKTEHQAYNQISLGLETLGKNWDARINGYLPVGDKKSGYFHRKFHRFSGHSMFVSRKREFALKGANLEIGAHVDNIPRIPFYFAAGPYYLNGEGKTAWGGEIRAAVDFFDHVRLEGNTSYDHLFKWIGQGQLSIMIPFGGKKTVRQKKDACSRELMLRERAVQRVDRNEIIPVDKKRKTSLAINPNTEQPYVFWFVNNTSSSNGTIESPYPTLLQAQTASLPNDVIYVFQGDGTSTGMDSGLALQEGQRLLGSGTHQNLPTTIGSISIPAFTAGMPLLTNPGNNIVTLAHNNTVSGIHFVDGLAAIFGSSITNATLENNQFTPSIVQTSINLSNTSGNITIAGNLFTAAVVDANANGIVINNTDTSATIAVLNNTFNNHGGFGVFIGMNGACNHVINCVHNTLTAPIGFESPQGGPFPPGPGPNGIRVQGADTSIATVFIAHNLCLFHEAEGISILTLNNTVINSSIASNTVQPGTLVPITGPVPSIGIVLESGDSGVQHSIIEGNIVMASKTSGIGFANLGAGNCTVTVDSNTVTGGGQAPGGDIFGGGIIIAAEGTGNVTAQVKHNTLLQNLQEGGVVGLGLNVSSLTSPGTLCLKMLNNTSDTGYILYNPNVTASPPINLEVGYQTNTGTINFVSPLSSSIPPVPPFSIPPSFFFGPGGPITIVPPGTCQ
jgi:trimeric autotransporter adhesin